MAKVYDINDTIFATFGPKVYAIPCSTVGYITNSQNINYVRYDIRRNGLGIVAIFKAIKPDLKIIEQNGCCIVKTDEGDITLFIGHNISFEFISVSEDIIQDIKIKKTNKWLYLPSHNKVRKLEYISNI